MQEGDFFAQFRLISERVHHLSAYHTSVNAGSWQLLIDAGNQVLAECVAHAVKQGENQALPEDLPSIRIPEGFKRCNGPCKRVLAATNVWFQRDSSKKKTGLRGRCKSCLSTKKKRDREDDPLSPVVAPPAAAEEDRRKSNEANVIGPTGPIAPGFVFCGEKRQKVEAPEYEYSLDVDGFEVIHGGFPISEEELEALKHHAMAMMPETDVIFNNAAADDEKNDKRRSQVEFKRFIGTDAMMARLHERLNGKLREMYPWLTPNDMVILRSDAGCADQRSHTDYTWQDWKRRHPKGPKRPKEPKEPKEPKGPGVAAASANVPLACVAAVMPNTYFDLWPRAIDCFEGVKDGHVFSHLRLVLTPGDLLIFRGDLVHAGAAFDAFNIRIHTYLDAMGVRRTKDTTFYMDAEAGCDYILPRKI
jgi:hypothetical protein